MFEAFTKFIPRAANKFGVSRQMQAAKVCHDCRKILNEAFEQFPPEQINENANPAHFKNSELTIKVSNSAWAQEIAIRKEKIIRDLNARAGSEIVKNLRTQLDNQINPDF